ncbi:MAG TPA: hypothetical protein P5267_03840, partial [Patescibacteria group bacterium]|nr:hypothetical protein [Patescibacteria group bacterium]
MNKKEIFFCIKLLIAPVFVVPVVNFIGGFVLALIMPKIWVDRMGDSQLIKDVLQLIIMFVIFYVTLRLLVKNTKD